MFANPGAIVVRDGQRGKRVPVRLLEICRARCYSGLVSADLQIRGANAGDLPEMVDLWLAKMALRQLGDRRLRFAPDAAEQRLAALRSHLQDPSWRLLVGLRGQQLAGYAIACERAGEPGLLPAKQGHVLEMTMDIHGEAAGPGGRFWPLLRAWFRQRGLDEVIVHVPGRQPVEQAFWRSLSAGVMTELFWMKT